MSGRSSPESYSGGVGCLDNNNEREFLASVQLATVPQQTFSKADEYYVQASKLDDEAIELAKKLQDVKNSAEDFRMTAFDLRRLATHDRAQIQAELDTTLTEHTDILALFGSNPNRAKRIEDLILAVEEGTVLPGAVNDIARDLSLFRSAQNAKTRYDTGSLPPLSSIDASVKRERRSSSSNDSIFRVNSAKKIKLDAYDEDTTRHDDEHSIAGTYSADQTDGEKDSDKESVILGSPMKGRPIEYMAAGNKNRKVPELDTSSPYSDRIIPIKRSKKLKLDRQQSYNEPSGPQAIDNGTSTAHDTVELQAPKKKKKQKKKNRESGSFQKEFSVADLDAKRRASLKLQKNKHYDI